MEESKKKKKKSKEKFRIKIEHRMKLRYYLQEFYKRCPDEKYTVFHFVKYFKRRLKKNKDAWMGVCGDTSVGKSYFVIMCMILFGRPMNLHDNIAYIPKGKEILDMFDKLNFQCLLIDEAAREMRSVNWHSKQQQGVNVRAMTDRFKNNWTFLNMPNFNEFTKSMRAGNLLFRAIIPYRTDTYARIIIQRKSRNWRSDDPWNDKEATERYEKFEKRGRELTNDVILNIERSLPCSVMDFIIPNMALVLPDVVTEYERLKLESREIQEDEFPIKKNIYKEKYEQLMNRVTKLMALNTLGIGVIKVSKGEMANALGVSRITFNKFLDEKPPEESKNFRKKDKQLNIQA